jgi:ankyrin repeat protein
MPPEIILLIAGHLVSPKDIFSFLRVSKKFYGLLLVELYQKNVTLDGGSALLWYAIHGNEVGIQNMLAAGADVNLRPPNWEAQSTALLEAVIHKHTNVVQLLLENGALADAADLRSRRPLALATVGRSDLAITKLLLDYGAMVDAVSFDKRPPLMEAILSNQESKVALLLKYGANPDILERRNTMNLLHVAAKKNAASAIIKMLIDAGISVDSQDGWGRTPLQVAVDHACTRAVCLLLRYGANANFKNTNQYWKGWTPLFYAAKHKNSRNDKKVIIRALVNNGAQVDATNDVGETPLLYAVSRGAIKQAQVLLENGANIMARDSNGKTVLHLAASSWSWCPDMMRWLVDRGADVNGPGGKQNETPIFYAIRHCYGGTGEEKVRNLLSLGADVHFRNIDGLVPLSMAARMRSIESIMMLLSRGALVNSRDIQGKSPLHHVAETSFGYQVHGIITLLIQHRVDMNARDHSGYTPLHSVVAKKGAWEAAGELLKAGADRQAMSHDGKFPHDMVPDGPWAETQRLFLRHYSGWMDG